MENSYKKYSAYLLLSLFLTLVGSFIGCFMSELAIYSMFALSLILIFAFLLTKGKVKKILFYIFCLGEGISLTPILFYYTETSILSCVILTFIATLIFLFVGMKVKNLSFLRSILLISLIALLMYQITGLFFPLPSLALVGVIIFCAYIAYDINRFKIDSQSGYMTDDDILNHVMDMYLNMINLFLYLLRLFGSSDD